MKKLFLYITLGLLWCNVGFAEKIYIKCKFYGSDENFVFAAMDFDKMKLSYGGDGIISDNFDYDIIESNDLLIKAKKLYWIDFPEYNGRVLISRNITIDRINGTLQTNPIKEKDTRVNVPEDKVWGGYPIFSTKSSGCEKIKAKSKF